jgi:molybdopterin-guanine dinucleotide biosynthesis protein A
VQKNITAIILAGGKSSRMGTDKGLMDLNGKAMVEHVLASVRHITNNIIIVANNNKYNRFGYIVYKDILKNCGPMGGIYSGLTYSTTENNLVISCDIPFISNKLLQYVIKNSNGYDVAVPVHNGKLEPLCAIYSKKCVQKLKDLLLKKELKMHDALSNFHVKKVVISPQQNFYSEKLFQNINSKDELKKAKGIVNEN